MEIFSAVENENFVGKNLIVLTFLLKTLIVDTVMLELPQQGNSNEYPQSMFWTKNKKNRYTPTYPSFTI